MRTKTVFKSSELPHIWAHQRAPLGRCSSSMSFNGTAFYSYSTVIARIITHKGRKAFVVDRASFSSTTSGHQSAVRRAIPSSEKTFLVECGRRGQDLDFTPSQLRDLYLAEYAYKSSDSTSRYEHIRARALLARYRSLEQAIEVCEYFGLASAKLKAELADGEPAIAQAKQITSAKQEKQRVACEYRWAHREEIRKEQQARYEAKQIETIQRWIAGESVQVPYGVSKCYLRAVNGTMETSKGAIVPLEDAHKAYRFAVVSRARGWHRNGEQFAVGQYHLDAVNEVGVIAGCHRVTWEEIERFAKQQGWA